MSSCPQWCQGCRKGCQLWCQSIRIALHRSASICTEDARRGSPEVATGGEFARQKPLGTNGLEKRRAREPHSALFTSTECSALCDKSRAIPTACALLVGSSHLRLLGLSWHWVQHSFSTLSCAEDAPSRPRSQQHLWMLSSSHVATSKARPRRLWHCRCELFPL
jgi:hypothetical protein